MRWKNVCVCHSSQLNTRKAATPTETFILCFQARERSRTKASNMLAYAKKLAYWPPYIKIARPTVQNQELKSIRHNRNRSRRSCQRSRLPSQAYAKGAHTTSRNIGAARVKLKQTNQERLFRLSRGKTAYKEPKKTNDVAANTGTALCKASGGYLYFPGLVSIAHGSIPLCIARS